MSPTTTEQHLSDFFTFCGKISSISFDAPAHTATIHFEKPQAAKTAVMLNGGTLDGAQISVTSENAHLESEDKHDGETHDGSYRQEDKPKAGSAFIFYIASFYSREPNNCSFRSVAAEYLAKGYKLSDHILQRAIEYDTKQGISTKFLSYFQTLDTTVGAKALGPEKTLSGKFQETLTQAQTQAKTIDEQKGLSTKAIDVCLSCFVFNTVSFVDFYLHSITLRLLLRRGARKLNSSTPLPRSKSWIFTRRRSVSRIYTNLPLLHPRLPVLVPRTLPSTQLSTPPQLQVRLVPVLLVDHRT